MLGELRPECGKGDKREGKPERAEPRSQMDVRSPVPRESPSMKSEAEDPPLHTHRKLQK